MQGAASAAASLWAARARAASALRWVGLGWSERAAHSSTGLDHLRCGGSCKLLQALACQSDAASTNGAPLVAVR